MSKQPFRIAFVGRPHPEMESFLAQISPHLQPLFVATWDALQAHLETFQPELVVVTPDLPPAPPFELSVPLRVLREQVWDKTCAEVEHWILSEPGRVRLRSPEYELLGRSPAIARVRGALVATANNALPVLLTGENGTGKDLAATVIHRLSTRCDQPFIAVNCGAIPSGLAEAEFFGCVRGAFTGAENRPGLCQQAQGGTLFLDEIGELAPEIQGKLLRALDNHEVRRLGSRAVEPTSFRLVCATNRHLVDEVAGGRFRQDLFYRINVLTLGLPPLRERLEDLPILASHFLRTEALDLRHPVFVGKRALAKMAEYHWPGNLRQLRNVLLRAVVLYDPVEVEPRHIEWEP